VHVPAATKVIVAPFVPPAVQTAGVVVVNVIGWGDVEVAVTITGDWAIVLVPGPLNVITCLTSVTVNVLGRSGAGAYVPFPPCEATIVQLPAARRLTVAPLGPVVEQTPGVVDAKVTGRPDVAVAETVKGVWSIVRLDNALKVIDWAARLTVKLRDTVGAGLNVALPG
jgi:hypothetical protein